MKILHTSDWHIGKDMRTYDRADEHDHFIDQLCGICAKERPDALLVSGDIFDTSMPTAQQQAALVRYMMALRGAAPGMRIIVTAGNHDSGTRLDAHRPLWHAAGINMVGTCERRPDGSHDLSSLVIDIDGKGLVIAAPYFHPRSYPATGIETEGDNRAKRFFAALQAEAERKAGDSGVPIVMMAHLAVSGSDASCHEDKVIGGMDTEPAETMGAGFDYLALGHIHRPQTLESPYGNALMRYSGSPFAMSFAEEFDHTVTVVDIGRRGQVPSIREIKLDELRRVRTIRPDDGTWQSAMEMLEAADADDESYVKIVVAYDTKIPANAKAEIERAVVGKKLRVCDYVRELPDAAAIIESAGDRGFALDEFKEIEPMDIAKLAYKEKHLSEMPKSWIEKLSQACDRAASTQKQ